VNERVKSDGTTALLAATEAGHADVVSILLRRGADVNATTTDVGTTPLIVAAKAGDAATVKLLLASHANVGAKASRGRTALLEAEAAGHTEVVKLLLSRGAGVMISLPAATFCMGSQRDSVPFKDAPRRVPVEPFQIDPTEVTVAEYGACVNAKKCRAPGVTSPSDTDATFCNWGQPDRANHPVNCVSWEDAKSYCGWAGKRLPTEGEWEYAARGNEGRTEPWGSKPAPYALCWGQLESGTCEVASFPEGDSPLGVKDLGGNVAEWTATQFSRSLADPPIACKPGEWCVYRGRSWTYAYPGGATERWQQRSTHRSDRIGFRCAR